MSSTPPDSEKPDALCHLLGKGSQIKVSPTFVSETVKRALLTEQLPASRWSVVPFKTKIISIASITAAAACLTFFVLLNSAHPTVTEQSLAQVSEPPATELSYEIEDALAHELLMAAAEDPDSISSEELMVLLF